MNKVTAPHRASSVTFRDIVIHSQEAWRAQHKPIGLNLPLSQSIDLQPSLVAAGMDLIIGHMPTYIDQPLRKDLKERHPAPVIGVGMFSDPRFFTNEHQFRSKAPEGSPLHKGLQVLNEIATDTLTQEVIHNLGRHFKPFLPVAAYLEVDNPVRPQYEKPLKTAKRLLYGDVSFENFRQELVKSMFSGNNDEVNNMLNMSGFNDIREFATEIGSKTKYTSLEGVLIRALSKSGIFRSSMSGGFGHPAFPGVIFMPQLPYLFYSTNMLYFLKHGQDFLQKPDHPMMIAMYSPILLLTGYLGFKTGAILPHLFTHETIHYLSQDVDHWGLLPVDYLGTEK